MVHYNSQNRNSVAVVTTQAVRVEERIRSCSKKSKLDNLLLSQQQADPKIITALLDTFSEYPAAGNHFKSSLGIQFSAIGQTTTATATATATATTTEDNAVASVASVSAVDTAAADAQPTIILQPPRPGVVPPPVVMLSRDTKVKAEDMILLNKHAFHIKGSNRKGSTNGRPRDSISGQTKAKSRTVMKLITAITNPTLTDQQQILVLRTAAEHPLGRRHFTSAGLMDSDHSSSKRNNEEVSATKVYMIHQIRTIRETASSTSIWFFFFFF